MEEQLHIHMHGKKTVVALVIQQKILTGLGAGTYSVTVTDANNCTTTASAEITEPVEINHC